MATVTAITTVTSRPHSPRHLQVAQLSPYRELVAKALWADLFTLDEFPVLSTLPVVVAWAQAHPREMLPRGKVLRALLRRAVGDVRAAVNDAQDLPSQRLGQFVQLRYQEQHTVTAIAERLQLTRAYVSRSLSRRATEVIARRFAQLAESAQLQASSAEPAAKAS